MGLAAWEGLNFITILIRVIVYVLYMLCSVSESEGAIAKAPRLLRDTQTLFTLLISAFKQVGETQLYRNLAQAK